MKNMVAAARHERLLAARTHLSKHVVPGRGTSVSARLAMGLLTVWLSNCGDTVAPDDVVSATTDSANNDGIVSVAPEVPKVAAPMNGTSAEMPIAAVDNGSPPAVAIDAGARKIDAGMSPQPTADETDAGALMPDAATQEPMASPALPPVNSVTADGPFSTTMDEGAGPGRAALVVRPTMLGENGLKHPIFVWGPGRGTRVRDYESLMRRIASHGFVVYSEISRAADGTEMVAAMTWLTGENVRADSPYYQMLDESKIAVGGHSFGSNSAMTAASDPRVKAFIHTAGSGFRGAGKALNLKQPAAFICGEDDPTANVTDCRTDYMQTSSPVFFTILAGEDHLSTVSAGLPLIVAWLRWHLGDEADRKSMFIGDACDFCTGVYTSQSKSWQ